MLRTQNGGVARRACIDGKIVDVRWHEWELSEVALDLGRGGVGFYRNSNFVHLDTGRVRRWLG
jgi:uncharacterized protein YcbK (DUF882 family)